MRIALKTFGCKVNQAESDLFAAAVLSGGMTCVGFQECADIYVINSCSVTKEAERKANRCIRRIMRDNPDAIVLLTGCYARRLEKSGERPFGEKVIHLVSPQKIAEILNQVEEITGETLSLSTTPYSLRSRVWLKVADGCEHFCSYCIVPHLRGPVKSISPQDVLQTAKDLEERGYREIVLCGINLAWYGKERENVNLLRLLEMLVEETRYARFRLSSLEPFAVNHSFFTRCLALGERICPHFHLPMQSGSDAILQKMKRGYSVGEFLDLVKGIRSEHPLVAITSDVMVGFPGESDEHFEQTAMCMQKADFSRTHLFRYSSRPGTDAAILEREEGVPEDRKRERERQLRIIADESAQRYRKKFIGKSVPVLVENIEGIFGFGHSDTYLPVRFLCPLHIKEGEIVQVFVESDDKDFLFGETANYKEKCMH